MPLINSSSKKALGENIAIERHAGKPEKQAIAIAESKKREVGDKMWNPKHEAVKHLKKLGKAVGKLGSTHKKYGDKPF